jgi:hypothetical protein
VSRCLLSLTSFLPFFFGLNGLCASFNLKYFFGQIFVCLNFLGILYKIILVLLGKIYVLVYREFEQKR